MRQPMRTPTLTQSLAMYRLNAAYVAAACRRERRRRQLATIRAAARRWAALIIARLLP